MANFEVGTHNIKKGFDCLECAKKFYYELKCLKYLAEVGISGRPKKIIVNTYGWKNDN